MKNYEIAVLTPSQRQRILGGDVKDSLLKGISGDRVRELVKKSAACDKKGNLLYEYLDDMAGRENAVLICNLAADDERSLIDAFLAENFPGRLASGIALMALAGGCNEVIIYAPTGLDLNSVLGRLEANGTVAVRAQYGEASLVLRENTALYSVFDTGEIRSDPAEYAYRQTFFSQGWQSRPTLVVDGETACSVSCLAQQPEASQTKLVVLHAEKILIAEAIEGAALHSLLSELGLEAGKSALIGGMLGRFVLPEGLAEEKITFDRLYDSVTLLTNKDCIASYCSKNYSAAKDMSCCKCVICREGSWHLSVLLNGITDGKAKRDDIALIEDIAPLIAQGALCGFGKEMPGPVISALMCHRAEIEAHITKKTCPANQCASFQNFIIDPILCTGCGDCMDACDEDAIEGKAGYIHMIDAKMCTKCGKCREVCPEDAVKVGDDGIRAPRKLTKAGMFGK